MKDFSNIVLKDVKDINEFDRTLVGYHYTKVYADDVRHIYVFKMDRISGDNPPYSNYEVVKGVKHKNTDGNFVYRYPHSSEFGKYGKYVCGREEKCQERIREIIRSWEEVKDA